MSLPIHALDTYSYIDGLVQDWCISIANALEILQSCTKQSMGTQLVSTTSQPAYYPSRGWPRVDRLWRVLNYKPFDDAMSAQYEFKTFV